MIGLAAVWAIVLGVVAASAFFVYFFFGDVAGSIIGLITAIAFFISINVLFIYIWYYIGKWIWYIIINAKSFVQRSVNWILTIFE